MSEFPSFINLKIILLYVHIFCLSINGHLDNFCVLVIMNNAAMNIGVKYLIEAMLSILLGVNPEMELLDRMVILFLIFEEWLYCFL